MLFAAFIRYLVVLDGLLKRIKRLALAVNITVLVVLILM